MSGSWLHAISLLTCIGYASFAAAAAPPAADPCAKIAGKSFILPTDALACQKAFPFNETLRQNVLSNIAGVFDFFTFEDYYLKSPPPFQESTVDIRATLARLNRTRFAVCTYVHQWHYITYPVLQTDYDFNWAVYQFTTQLNDGHTRMHPSNVSRD